MDIRNVDWHHIVFFVGVVVAFVLTPYVSNFSLDVNQSEDLQTDSDDSGNPVPEPEVALQ